MSHTNRQCPSYLAEKFGCQGTLICTCKTAMEQAREFLATYGLAPSEPEEQAYTLVDRVIRITDRAMLEQMYSKVDELMFRANQIRLAAGVEPWR